MFNFLRNGHSVPQWNHFIPISVSWSQKGNILIFSTTNSSYRKGHRELMPVEHPDPVPDGQALGQRTPRTLSSALSSWALSTGRTGTSGWSIISPSSLMMLRSLARSQRHLWNEEGKRLNPSCSCRWIQRFLPSQASVTTSGYWRQCSGSTLGDMREGLVP